MKSLLYLFLLSVSSLIANAQGLQIVDINQLFSPSVRFEAEQTLPQKITGEDAWLSTSRIGTSALVPIAGDLGLNLSVDIDKPKDLLNWRKNINPKGYQLSLNAGVQYIRPHFTTYENQTNIVQANLGALALHYHNVGAMFYALNFNITEDTSFQPKTRLNYSALIGYVKVMTLRKQVFYGAVITPINKIPVPIPFYGLNKKLNKKWRMTMLLPIQMGFIYKHNRKLRQYFDVGLNALGAGIPNLDGTLLTTVDKINLEGRTQFSKAELRFRTCLKYKHDRNLILMAHTGINSGSIMFLKNGNYTETDYLTPTLFFNVSVNYLFTKSLMRNLLKEIIEW